MGEQYLSMHLEFKIKIALKCKLKRYSKYDISIPLKCKSNIYFGGYLNRK
jgi:hypothetical protein